VTDPFAWTAVALEQIERRDLRRHLQHRAERTGERVGGLVSFASNDYLGLAGDPRLAAAAADAAQRWGAGAGASRLVTGGTTLHRELESELAAWKGSQDAVLFSSGYLANLGTIAALVGDGDAVFSDELNHASIIDACRLSRAAVRVYPHRDAEALDRLLAATPAHRRLIVTDGVFSMDGDAADLPVLFDVAEQHGAMLVVDDAHGCGVVGPDGRGTAAAQRCSARPHLTIGTLSKAFGAAGGYVTGPAQVCELLRNRARTFVFDTAPPPPVAAAALAGLRIAAAEPWRRQRAVALAGRLSAALPGAPPAFACVVPLVIGAAADALAAAQRLHERGIHVVAIRPPSVPEGTARLRFATSAAHAEDDVDAAIGGLSDVVTLPA
jgi:8-amino-7-oxononanoate synthase